MKKKIALSIEQMKHLEELGLDTSDASMYYGCRGQLEFMIPDLNMDVCTPAYTLQDILEKFHKYHITEEYIIVDDCPIYGYKERNQSPLEASYQLLLWCIENKHIKTN